MILVTGGAGFIGANFILDWLATSSEPAINLDKLTYAGNPNNLASLKNNANYIFVHGDIADRALVAQVLSKHQPRAILNFAAESHVDRSIHGPASFIETNIVGTFNLLDVARTYWQGLGESERKLFRFLHVSTDEVYGSLELHAPAFTEDSGYLPNSPYAASKAGSDHLVRAWYHTYGLPTLTTNCSNNYGPYQFPEKLIPLIIVNALAGKPLPIYGDGQAIRDWLYVTDHCAAIRTVLSQGQLGEVYNIGGNCEKTNLEVVQTVCKILDEIKPESRFMPHSSLITFVKDRPGHDRRYAMNNSKIQGLGWKPTESFASGIRKTIQWYLSHPDWIANILSGEYKKWLETNYAMR